MPDPLACSHGGAIRPHRHTLPGTPWLDETGQAAPLRLGEKRNGPNVRQRFHGILFARAPGDSVDSLPACRRLYALRGHLEARIPGVCCRGTFLSGYGPLDAARISNPPIHLHYEPKTRVGKRLHYIIHGVHHDYPNDARRLVMPPSVSVPLAFLFYGMFLLIFGPFASSVFAGLVFGYVCYDMLHYATHHFPMKRGVLLWLKQYHLRHHYKDDHVGYGISSPLWDYVFRTTRR